MIEAENASFTYQSAPSPALQDVTLTVQPGECVVLCGRSGCGKTTFTHLLNGLSPEFYPGTLTGRCTAAGLAAGEAAIEDYVPQVGSVFQNPKTQYFNVDTTAELAFPCENAGMEPQAIRRRVDEVVEQFQLGPLMDRSVFKLSGGEKQRVAFAAACMLGPRLLVLDEPTNDLDIVTLQVLEEYLQGFGGCLIVVSHDRYFMNKVVDHLLVFEGEGRIRDFPGNYDEYLEWKQLRDAELRTRHDAESGTVPVQKRPARNDKRRLSFNEKRELERLEKEIPELEARKAELEQSLCSGTLPIDELTRRSVEVSELIGRIDELSMRWLELSEIGE